MYFYQAQWQDDGNDGNQFGKLRQTREEAIADLAAMGCPVDELVDTGLHVPMYVPNMGYGIAVTRV